MRCCSSQLLWCLLWSLFCWYLGPTVRSPPPSWSCHKQEEKQRPSPLALHMSWLWLYSLELQSLHTYDLNPNIHPEWTSFSLFSTLLSPQCLTPWYTVWEIRMSWWPWGNWYLNVYFIACLISTQFLFSYFILLLYNHKIMFSFLFTLYYDLLSLLIPELNVLWWILWYQDFIHRVSCW